MAPLRRVPPPPPSRGAPPPALRSGLPPQQPRRMPPPAPYWLAPPPAPRGGAPPQATGVAAPPPRPGVAITPPGHGVVAAPPAGGSPSSPWMDSADGDPSLETMDGISSFTGSIDTMGYYTNLINSDGIDAGGLVGQDSQSEDTPVDVSQSPAVRSNPKRSKNFSEEEDVLLVGAWLNVTLDPVQGTDQTRSTYWNRIHEYFHDNRTFESNRSQGSLTHRWSTIQECVNRF